jgi:glycosyltransferase involved in cell wall biosynthesis
MSDDAGSGASVTDSRSATRRVAIVDLGRASAMGATRRVESWSAIARAAGTDVELVALSSLRRASAGDLAIVTRQIGRGLAVPEAMGWSRSALIERLDELQPDLTIFVTLRAWDTHIAVSQKAVVLDAVDHLSHNYATRARVARVDRAAALATLSRFHRRAERVVVPLARRLGTVVAAGSADATALGAQWVPITMDPTPASVDNRAADHDLCFVGNLAYEPNLDALHQLADIWPALQMRRPGTRLLVAGSNGGAALDKLASRHGWTLLGPFDHLESVLARATIAVAPMRIATGIQCKVLDAARHGVAQVVSPHVMAGLGEDFPVVVAATDAELVLAITGLLDDPVERAALSNASRGAMRDHYSAEAWAPWLATLLDTSVAATFKATFSSV